MLSLGGNHRVFLSRSPVDFRKAHDGLCSVIRDEFRDDPFAGDVFVFFNRAKDRIKLVVWDRNGFWLLYKRLEKGRFPFAVSGAGRVEIEQGQLAMILEGIEWKSAKRASRFSSVFAITSRNGSGSRASA
jgi:transposase